MEITGTVKYLTFAEGSKSESLRPYVCVENGTRILLYKKNDNPFENKGFSEYDGCKVQIKGEFVKGVLEVDEIALLEKTLPENVEEEESKE